MASWRKLVWVLFVLPGVIVLWVQYYFPSKGQLWASRRRKDNFVVQVLYSVGLWVLLAFVLVAHSGQATLP